MSLNGLFVNVSGLEIFVHERIEPQRLYDLVKQIKTADWEYIFLLRRNIGFSTVFNVLSRRCNGGFCFVRIYFYELRNKYIDLLIKMTGKRSFLLVSSNPPPSALLKRIVANPKYGETLLFISRLREDLVSIEEEVLKNLEMSKKLFLELVPVVFSMGLGKLLSLMIEKEGDSHRVILCVNKPGVSVETTHSGINLVIKSIDKCFS